MSSDFYVDVRVFFPIKKKRQTDLFSYKFTEQFIGFWFMHYTRITRLVHVLKKNGYNTLPGFTLIQWNQIIVITRNAVRNDE